MDSPSPQRPQYEPGGDRIMIVVVVIVVTALAGMLFSFFSRQHAPADAPPPRSLHLPPSAKPDVAATAPATATPNPPPPAPTR